MAITIQKKQLICGMVFMGVSSMIWANTLHKCSTAPIEVTRQIVGQATYFAENCAQVWSEQSIRIDFDYSRAIPEWALKRAATHFLSKNLGKNSNYAVFNSITQHYLPIKAGDRYRLTYTKASQTLTLSMNQQFLAEIRHPQANQYFQICFGATPFSVKLKQQLLINRKY